MGQKVNPIGFRTGIMIGWKSRWYASKQEFSQLLIEDKKIRDYVKTRKDKFGKPLYPAIAKIEIERMTQRVKESDARLLAVQKQAEQEHSKKVGKVF